MTDLYLVLVVLIWGMNYAIIKHALAHFSPLSFNGLRFLLASLVLFVWFAVRKKRLPRFGTDWRWVLVVALLGHVLYQITFIYGANWTRAGNTSLILASTPVFVAIFSMIAGHETITGRMWLGIFSSFLGVSLIVLGSAHGVEFRSEGIRGDMTVLGAAVLWSAYIVSSTRLVRNYGAIATTAATLWVGAPILLAFSLSSLVHQDWGAIDLADWAALFYSGLLAIAVAQVIWYRAIRERGNARTSVYSNIVPLVGLLAAWPMLGEKPRPLQIAGAAAILTGAFLAGIRRESPAGE